MKKLICLFLLQYSLFAYSQPVVDLKAFKTNGAKVTVNGSSLTIQWPGGPSVISKAVLNLQQDQPLFTSIGEISGGKSVEIIKGLDPVFVLREGKRTLSPSSGGWDVFFDKVPNRPYTTELIRFDKGKASVHTLGSATVVKIDRLKTKNFSGRLEVTFYNGSPLLNIAAVITTGKDSTAILYDAGLVNKQELWKNIA